MSTELEHLADTILRAHQGDAWSGPSLSELLGDVTDQQSAAKPAGAPHSIWELTLHIGAWNNIVRRRLEGEVPEVPWEENFPTPFQPPHTSWPADRANAIHEATLLGDCILKFPAARLDETVPGKDYSFAVMLHGAAQHALYHAGQIALLKRLVATQ